eukprot:260941-Chlamydomonas_euryale.AAC.4
MVVLRMRWQQLWIESCSCTPGCPNSSTASTTAVPAARLGRKQLIYRNRPDAAPHARLPPALHRAWCIP